MLCSYSRQTCLELHCGDLQNVYVRFVGCQISEKCDISSRFVCSRVYFFIFIDCSTHTKAVQCHWVDECAWWRYRERGSKKQDKFVHNLHVTSTCPCAAQENQCESEYIAPVILNLDSISRWVVTSMSRLFTPGKTANGTNWIGGCPCHKGRLDTLE
jgi:hypothetical protein